MRRLVAPLLLLLSACAAPRAREKMTFQELYAGYARSSPRSDSASVTRRARAQAEDEPEGVEASASLELRGALLRFAESARAERARVPRGGPMSRAQADNWAEMNARMDAFLHEPARRTLPLDVVRARATLEAELELDARAYGDMPAALADAVIARVDGLAVRMAELRRLQVRPKATARRFAWPVEPVAITSVFGTRRHPITQELREHLGVDLGAKAGQRVSVAAKGVVLKAGWNGSHGLHVEVQHAGEVVTRYSHLSRVLVEVGEVLEQGDAVGLAGKTGLATGVHLHFELWRRGQPQDPLEELGPAPGEEEDAAVPVARQGAAAPSGPTASFSAPWPDGSPPSSRP